MMLYSQDTLIQIRKMKETIIRLVISEQQQWTSWCMIFFINNIQDTVGGGGGGLPNWPATTDWSDGQTGEMEMT